MLHGQSTYREIITLSCHRVRCFKTLNGQKPIKLQVKNDGLIRCYERLSKLTEETINPLLLPTKGKTIELLIEDHHKKTERMGVLIYLCFFERNLSGRYCWSIWQRISSSFTSFYCPTEKGTTKHVRQSTPIQIRNVISVDVAWKNAARDPDIQSNIVKQRIKWSLIV